MNKKVHNFKQSKKTGEMGENAVQDLLKDFCYYAHDVTEQKEFYEPDIDYICIDKDLDTEYIELKTDTYTASNGNIFIETVSNDTTNKKGWYYECEADWLWYFAVPQTVYLFRLEELRDELGEKPVEYCEEAEEKEVFNKNYRSKGVTIPLESIPERLYTEQQVPQAQ